MAPPHASIAVSAYPALPSNTGPTKGCISSASTTFLKSPTRKKGGPGSEILNLESICRLVGELRHHLRMMQNGPCNQVGKVSDEQRIRDESWLGRLALISVDEKRDLRKGEE